MTIQLKQRLISVDDYHKMIEAGILGPEDRVELIEGKIIEMAPVGSLHAAYVDKISKLLNKLIGEGTIIRTQSPVQFLDISEPEPDVSVLKPRRDFYATQHPQAADIHLIIEVSGSSLDVDREVKIPLYAKAGVPEYWIININDEEIEVYHTPTKGDYKYRELVKPGEQVRLIGIDLVIPADDLFIEQD
jgi:Uma2 family endonuclease